MSDVVYSTMMVELDALLDSRASILFKMNPDAFEKILKKDYFKRRVDIFENIDNDLYKELYSKRNKEVLKNSIITNIGEMMKEFCQTTLDNTLKTPFHLTPKLIINVFPYDLLEEELNIIVKGVAAVTNGIADIEIVNMSPEQLTPTYVKSKLSVLVLYDYWTWLETHSLNENFRKTTCPDVSLIGPRISFVKDFQVKEGDTDPFEAATELAAPIISLSLIDIIHFCFSAESLVKEKTNP